MFLMDQKGGNKSLDEGEASLSWYCIRGGVTPLPWRHAADPALLGEREPTSAEN